MNVTDTESIRARTAERAYARYLERQRLGLPGDEHDDWIRAERELAEQSTRNGPAPSSPVTAIRGIGPRVAEQLAEAGIRDATDLARWSLADFGESLPRLAARARSGRWIEQAREHTGIER